jgi:hypothetical protein
MPSVCKTRLFQKTLLQIALLSTRFFAMMIVSCGVTRYSTLFFSRLLLSAFHLHSQNGVYIDVSIDRCVYTHSLSECVYVCLSFCICVCALSVFLSVHIDIYMYM